MKVLKKLAMNFEAYLCAIAIAVMSVVVFVQVVFRFIVKSSLPWSEELSRYLQVYITFFGTAMASRLAPIWASKRLRICCLRVAARCWPSSYRSSVCWSAP